MKTAIRVISLERAKERRSSFAASAQGAAADWQFFPGYEQIAAPLVYDEKITLKRIGRAFVQAEIGCYTSHYKLWEWFAQSDYDQLIVMEDDVIADWDMLGYLSQCRLAEYGIDFLKFYAFPLNFSFVKLKKQFCNKDLVRLTSETAGAQAYLLTRRGAQIMLEAGRNMWTPVDCLLARYWEHGLTNYCLLPFPVIEKFTPTQIEHRFRTQKPPMGARWKEKWQRHKDKFARKIADIRVHGKNDKRIKNIRMETIRGESHMRA